ncbi:MAG TPA: MG2 domain-containing protein, partial [Gemmatimonadaceae bacterium]|nr:MG2 domain-containing protein [Gemmatimonadaceae bacterium]
MFSTPVRGAEVLRHVHLFPAIPFTVSDTAAEGTEWTLEARLTPRVAYAVVADTTLHDIFGQRLVGNPAVGFRTTGYLAGVEYPFGRLLVERTGFRTLAVQHMNVDTLITYIAPVADSDRARLLAASPWSLGPVWQQIGKHAIERRIAVRHTPDVGFVTTIPLPAGDTSLVAMKVIGVHAPDSTGRSRAAELHEAAVALLQVTDLAIHAKVGADNGAVWVTGVGDGRPRAGAQVVLHDRHGQIVATAITDGTGVAHFNGFRAGRGAPAAGLVPLQPASNDGDDDENDDVADEGPVLFQGYVDVRLGGDRGMIAVGGYEPDLSPWRFALPAAIGNTALPVAAAVFTDRGIYRPGERIYAKAIIRSGMLGALRRPAMGDSIQWQLRDREDALVRDTTVRLSAFGTAATSFTVPANAGLGDWTVRVRVARYGTWHTVEDVTVRVAEYRPPEFLVDVTADSEPHVGGESLRVAAQARYLFGAPMAHAALSWEARQTVMSPAALQIPGTDGWEIGDGRWWTDASESDEVDETTTVFASGRDTLDGGGRRAWRVTLPKPAKGQGARITVATTVTDVNRQVVVASASTVVHPASFYLAAKVEGSEYFWTAGSPVHIGVVAVRPSGERVRDVAVHGIVVRREWHQVRRVRGGVAELVGDWVTDTTGRCELTSGAEPAPCVVAPRAGGEYAVTFRATDEAGRVAETSVARWATGPGWVPWDDATQFKMDLVADRTSYRVGDTATVLVASPITNANAWLTIEREGVIEQRPLRVTGGSTSLRIPITEAFVPNVFVSVFLTRGRSAPPSKLDDPGRPTIRVGYVALRVLPDVKRLKVAVEPAAGEYRPGDTARIAIHVRDAGDVGRAAEVTVWAVDEGVLSLTGYRTPDPIDLLYAERGLGVRLSSNLSAVAPQVPEGEKGRRSPGGGGGADAAGVLRSRFQATAFFLTSVVTDSSGTAVAVAKLPDNLTTFRVMAVAVTGGDRYGSGASPMLVTRPLLARPALPRFVRGGDELTAGVVVNQRSGGTPDVRVAAAVQGAVLRGDAEQRATLEAGRGREVRFPFRVPERPAGSQDSVSFTFGVRLAEAQVDADRVRLRLPVRPDYTPRAHTIAGVLVDTATVHLVLPEGTDPDRSRLSISAGASPLAMIAGAARTLRVYPYDCSEQVTTEAMPILALYRGAPGIVDTAVARRQLRSAVDVLSRRQRTDGGIGLWDAEDWTTPYLSAYVGGFLAGARAAGIAVDDSVLVRLARYMRGATSNATPSLTPVSDVHESAAGVLSERVAAVSFLRRVGRPDVAAENDLIRQAAQLWPIDRARLAAVIARRRGGMVVARALLQPEWDMVRVEGRRAVFPDSAVHHWYFSRGVWLPAEVLIATLAVEPQHRLVGPLVEALVEGGRVSGGAEWMWTTHDFGALVAALSEFDAAQRAAVARGVTVRSGGRIVARLGGARAAGADTSSTLTGLLTGGALTLSLAADDGGGIAPLYYYVTVSEVPVRRPVTPDDAGIAVERWYERYDAATPIISAVEGELVRVRLKVTVREEREFLVLDDPLPAGLEA